MDPDQSRLVHSVDMDSIVKGADSRPRMYFVLVIALTRGQPTFPRSLMSVIARVV